MWRSVFLHEFLGLDLDNFQAVEGTFTSSLTSPPTPAVPFGAILVKPGQAFRYELDEVPNDVIGVSGRVLLNLPTQNVSGLIPVMRLGQDVELFMRFEQPISSGVVDGDLVADGAVVLRVGAVQHELATLRIPHRLFIDVRFDWHTSGQARLSVDGELVGYHNAVAPGVLLEVGDLVVGHPLGSPSATNPRYRVSRVFVRMLRRPDPLAAATTLLPPLDVSDDELLERCTIQAATDVLGAADRFRAFMSLVNAQLTVPWNQDVGPAAGPFSPGSIAAHGLALQALLAWVDLVKSGNPAGSDAFLDPFTELLGILHDAVPNEFESLAGELLGATPDELCSPVGEALLERNRETLGPIVDVLEAAGERLKSVAGVA